MSQGYYYQFLDRAHPSQDALLKKVAEFANKVTMKEAVNSELWLLGCEIYDEIGGARSTPSLPAQDARLFSLLLKICRNAYACAYQQNTFPGDCDPCGKCANCMADEVLGVNWELASGSTPSPDPQDSVK